MLSDNFFTRVARAWAQHWARIISADAAAAKAEPELPASVFVQFAPSAKVQPKASDRAAAQRSASISSSKG